MAMAGVRPYWLNRWNGLLGPGQSVGTFVFLLGFRVVVRVRIHVSWSEAIASHSLHFKYTTMAIFVELFHWPRTNRRCVCTPACLTLKVSLRFNPESLFHLLPMSQYITMTMVNVRLSCLHRWNDLAGSAWTASTFVLLYAWLWIWVRSSVRS